MSLGCTARYAQQMFAVWPMDFSKRVFVDNASIHTHMYLEKMFQRFKHQPQAKLLSTRIRWYSKQGVYPMPSFPLDYIAAGLVSYWC